MQVNKDIDLGAGVVWITGISASGKTTIGSGLYKLLQKQFINVILFDGDELRKKLPNKIWALY